MSDTEQNSFDIKSKQYAAIVEKLPVRFDTVTTLCSVAKAGRKIIKVKFIFPPFYFSLQIFKAKAFPKCITFLM